MRKKRFLAAILLGVVLCFVSVAGDADTNTVGSLSSLASSIRSQGFGDADRSDVWETWSESLKKAIQRGRAPERYTFLIVPIDQEDMSYTLSMLRSFLDMYSDPKIPEEFAWVLPVGIKKFISDPQGLLLYLGPREESLIPSLLLTMAYQQGYEIEHVTSSYVILVKPVYEEELKEWKDRLNE